MNNKLPLSAHSRLSLPDFRAALIPLLWLVCQAASAGGANFTLGANNLWQGPAAGSNSVVLAAGATNALWTNVANASWLHLSAANQTGAGGTNIVFSFDANVFATRSGTLTIAGQTLTVTQSGSTYVAAQPLTTLATITSPGAVALDASGNVYVSGVVSSNVVEWIAGSNAVVPLITNGLAEVLGLAADASTNLYVSDFTSNVVYQRSPMDSNLTTLFANGLNGPSGMALDTLTNLYVANQGSNTILEWTSANSNLTTLVPVSAGLNSPSSVAVDAAGNVYIAEISGPVLEWTLANSNLTALSTNITTGGYGLAVDGSGNVYFDSGGTAIEKWTAANGAVTAVASGSFSGPEGIAADATGNLYFAASDSDTLLELPHAFVDPSPKLENSAAGNDVLPAVLPVSENLLAPFAPASDQSWLTITGVTNGVVGFSFTATTSNRTANITLLGQTIPVTQTAPGAPLPPLLLVFDGTNAVTNGQMSPPVNFGSVQQTLSGPTLTFTVTNAGGQALALGAPSVPAGFALITTPTNTLAPGASATFSVQMASNAIGTNAGNITITNNNPTNNLFIFAITGLVVPPLAQIEVFDGTNVITNDGLTPINFGSVQQTLAGPVATFTLTNAGALALHLGTLTVPAGYSNITALPQVLSNGSNATFSVQLLSTNLGTHSGNISFTNDDLANNPFVIAITGTVTPPAPIIEVWQGTNLIVNGQTNALNFGVIQQGTNQPPSLDFTVSNVGTLPLNWATPTGPFDYLISPPLPPSLTNSTNSPFMIPGGQSSGFSVLLLANRIGTFTGQISFTNNDPNNEPFSFPVTGTVLGRVISLSGNLAFGGVQIDATSPPQTLTISNGGNETLTVTNIIYPPGFSGSWTNGTIAAGTNEAVTVTFSPANANLYNGAITVQSDATSGTNTIAVSGYGASGSLTLVVLTNGFGKVTPNVNGKTYRAGARVTLTAVPNNGNAFSGWSGSTNSSANPLTFTMAPSMLIQANFVTNPFLLTGGSYNGLFVASNGVSETTAGMIRSLNVTPKGTYTGAVLINGSSHPMSGIFNLAGQTTNRVTRPASQGGPLVVVMNVVTVSNFAPIILGTVTGTNSGVPWQALLTAEFATNTFPSAQYTMLILPATNSPGVSPGGYGYFLITNYPGTTKKPSTAIARITGALADGTVVSEAAPVSEDGFVPIYANLYGNKGLLLGWICMNVSNNVGVSLTWIHPARPSGLYKPGFTNIIPAGDILLSAWTNPPASPNLPTNLYMIDTLYDTNEMPIFGLTNTIAGGAIKVSGSSPAGTRVSGTINLKTGALKVTVGKGASAVTGYGAVLLDSTNGGGYFLTKTNAQAIGLTP